MASLPQHHHYRHLRPHHLPFICLSIVYTILALQVPCALNDLHKEAPTLAAEAAIKPGIESTTRPEIEGFESERVAKFGTSTITTTTSPTMINYLVKIDDVSRNQFRPTSGHVQSVRPHHRHRSSAGIETSESSQKLSQIFSQNRTVKSRRNVHYNAYPRYAYPPLLRRARHRVRRQNTNIVVVSLPNRSTMGCEKCHQKRGYLPPNDDYRYVGDRSPLNGIISAAPGRYDKARRKRAIFSIHDSSRQLPMLSRSETAHFLSLLDQTLKIRNISGTVCSEYFICAVFDIASRQALSYLKLADIELALLDVFGVVAHNPSEQSIERRQRRLVPRNYYQAAVNAFRGLSCPAMHPCRKSMAADRQHYHHDHDQQSDRIWITHRLVEAHRRRQPNPISSPSSSPLSWSSSSSSLSTPYRRPGGRQVIPKKIECYQVNVRPLAPSSSSSSLTTVQAV